MNSGGRNTYTYFQIKSEYDFEPKKKKTILILHVVSC